LGQKPQQKQSHAAFAESHTHDAERFADDFEHENQGEVFCGHVFNMSHTAEISDHGGNGNTGKVTDLSRDDQFGDRQHSSQVLLSQM
jgi:hypothetical protein